MDTITVPVLTFNQATSNSRFYTQDAIEKAVEAAQGKKFLCQYALPVTVTDADFGLHAQVTASHVVESIYVVGTELWAEVRFLPTPNGMQLKAQWERAAGDGNRIIFRAAGQEQSQLRADKLIEVTNFKFTGAHVAPLAF